jgi:hypothetical protein
MNNEQQELLSEAYENYWDSRPDAEKTFQYEGHNIETRRMTKDEFVEMVKTDKEYARRWGLKIEERELSLEERRKLANYDSVFVSPMTVESWDRNKIPTKLITITHKDKTIESYK